MSLLRMFLVIMTVIAAQAVTTAQETVPEPVPAPVPDPISTPGVGGIGNLLTCAALQVEIEELQEQIAGVNAGLEQVGPNDPMLVTLVFVRIQLEAQLFMLQWEYAVLCGGNPPPSGDPPTDPPVSDECEKKQREYLALCSSLNFGRYVYNMALRGQYPSGDPIPDDQKQNAIDQAQKAIENDQKAIADFVWPEGCDEPVINSGIPGMFDPTIAP